VKKWGRRDCHCIQPVNSRNICGISAFIAHRQEIIPIFSLSNTDLVHIMVMKKIKKIFSKNT